MVRIPRIYGFHFSIRVTLEAILVCHRLPLPMAEKTDSKDGQVVGLKRPGSSAMGLRISLGIMARSLWLMALMGVKATTLKDQVAQKRQLT